MSDYCPRCYGRVSESWAILSVCLAALAALGIGCCYSESSKSSEYEREQREYKHTEQRTTWDGKKVEVLTEPEKSK